MNQTNNSTGVIDPREEINRQEQLLEAVLIDPTAELGFLAALIQRPHWMEHALTEIKPEMLHAGEGQAANLYRMMSSFSFAMNNAGRPVVFDRITLFTYAVNEDSRLAQRPDFIQYLDAVLNFSGSINPDTTIHGFVHAIRRADRRIQSNRALRRCRDAVLMGTDDPTTALNEAQAVFDHLAGNAGGRIESVGAAELDLSGQKSQGIMPTFLPMLNDITSGFRAGTLSIVAARSGVGKSMLLNHIGVDVAVMQKIPVLVLDSEMTAQEVLSRAVSNLSGVDENWMRRGHCMNHPEHLQRVQQAQAAVQQSPFMHVSIAGWAPEQVVAKIKSFKRMFIDCHPARRGLVLLDYLKPNGNDGRTAEWQVLGQYAGGLKAAALEMNLPIVAGVQTNRSAIGMGQREFADNLASGTVGGSDRVMHNADVLLMLRNLNVDEQQKMLERFGNQCPDAPDRRNWFRFNQILHLNKHRGGRTLEAGIPLKMHYGISRYVEMGKQEMDFLHSREFTYKSKAGGKLKMTLGPGLLSGEEKSKPRSNVEVRSVSRGF